MRPDGARRLLAAAALLALPVPALAQNMHAVPPSVTHATSGGTWQAGNTRGYHRLLVLGGDPDRAGVRLVIQWIQESADPYRMVVRHSQPIHAIDAPWVLGPPQFVASANGVRATITGYNPHTRCSATWTVTLGPPGQYGVQPDR